jgi:type 1 fimbriae regulatory protein FimB
MTRKSNDRLSAAEVQSVFAAALDGRHGVRDHAMLLLLYRHGLRVSELCQMALADVDLEDARLWVARLNRGKSGAHPLAADEVEALRSYLEERQLEGMLEIPTLFVNERKAPLTRAAVYYLVRRAGETAGLSRPLFPHLLRRSAGYELAREGHDVRLIQDYLGLRTARSVLRFVPEASPDDGAERFTGLWRQG